MNAEDAYWAFKWWDLIIGGTGAFGFLTGFFTAHYLHIQGFFNEQRTND